ncbi:hypothetical protein [Krasilnikovia sp. MM14-A1259]|uniref:hypothetical protein n=1 Tax=Krasilnikovia sp. MM14-A1259 TaxID=3373539 RepID=UPI00399CE572
MSTASAEGRYCVSVLGKAPAAGQDSPELYRYCQDTPFDTEAYVKGATAQSQLRRSFAARGASAKEAAVQARSVNLHILRAWSDADFNGNFWDYYAQDADGHCDSAGYSWRPDDWWSTHLSSLQRGWNSYCNRVTLFDRAGSHSDTWDMDLSYVMARYNDNVARLQIFNGNGHP